MAEEEGQERAESLKMPEFSKLTPVGWWHPSKFSKNWLCEDMLMTWLLLFVSKKKLELLNCSIFHQLFVPLETQEVIFTENTAPDREIWDEKGGLIKKGAAEIAERDQDLPWFGPEMVWCELVADSFQYFRFYFIFIGRITYMVVFFILLSTSSLSFCIFWPLKPIKNQTGSQDICGRTTCPKWRSWRPLGCSRCRWRRRPRWGRSGRRFRSPQGLRQLDTISLKPGNVWECGIGYQELQLWLSMLCTFQKVLFVDGFGWA